MMRTQVRLVRAEEFWDIELEDRGHVIRTGRIGTRGKPERVAAASAEAACDAFEVAIVEQLVGGWQEPEASPDAKLPAGLEVREPALEQVIRDHRDDRDAYLVYADWLQAAGNPVGELITAAVRLADRKVKDARVQKRIDALVASLQLPLPDRASFRSRFGVWHALRLGTTTTRTAPSESRIPGLARVLFGHVLCCALAELTLGRTQWEDEQLIVGRVIEEAGRHAWAGGLRTLRLGMTEIANPPLSSYDAGAVGRLISKAFPGLRKLRVEASNASRSSSLTGLALPKLRELAIVGGALGTHRIEQLQSMQLPKLEHLELCLGASYGGAVPPRELGTLFDQGRFGGVRYLGLRTAGSADLVVDAVARWPIAAALETLDLRYGSLTDAGVEPLLATPGPLPKLRHLLIDGCYVSTPIVRALQARLPRVSAADQRPVAWLRL